MVRARVRILSTTSLHEKGRSNVMRIPRPLLITIFIWRHSNIVPLKALALNTAKFLIFIPQRNRARKKMATIVVYVSTVSGSLEVSFNWKERLLHCFAVGEEEPAKD